MAARELEKHNQSWNQRCTLMNNCRMPKASQFTIAVRASLQVLAESWDRC